MSGRQDHRRGVERAVPAADAGDSRRVCDGGERGGDGGGARGGGGRADCGAVDAGGGGDAGARAGDCRAGGGRVRAEGAVSLLGRGPAVPAGWEGFGGGDQAAAAAHQPAALGLRDTPRAGDAAAQRGGALRRGERGVHHRAAGPQAAGGRRGGLPEAGGGGFSQDAGAGEQGAGRGTGEADRRAARQVRRYAVPPGAEHQGLPRRAAGRACVRVARAAGGGGAKARISKTRRPPQRANALAGDPGCGAPGWCRVGERRIGERQGGVSPGGGVSVHGALFSALPARAGRQYAGLAGTGRGCGGGDRIGAATVAMGGAGRNGGGGGSGVLDAALLPQRAQRGALPGPDAGRGRRGSRSEDGGGPRPRRRFPGGGAGRRLLRRASG